jgi:hypothetical protein
MFKRIFSITCLFIASIPAISFAQAKRVEVDWEIVITEPDAAGVNPQISLIMANREELTGDFAEFRINPSYGNYIGGIKVDTWRGPHELDETMHFQRPPLGTANDKISFTTVAEAFAGRTHYGVENVNSDSWGNIDNSEFGMVTTSGAGVIQFDINLTLAESEVEYGHNRVDYVKVKEIRYYMNGNLARRDRTGYFIFKDGAAFAGPATPYEVIDEYIAF